MTEKKNVCPCCGRHCDLSMPSCSRGEEYARAAGASQRTDDQENRYLGWHKHSEHSGRHGHGGHGSENKEHGKHGERSECAVHIDRRSECEYRELGERGARRGRCAHGGRENLLESPRYLELDGDEKLFAVIQELGHISHFYFDGRGSQRRILHILAQNGEMSQKELTQRIRIQPGSASEVLGKLERAGFILRGPGTEDKRTAIVCLTEAGRARAAELEEERSARLHEAFTGLSDEEKQQLLTLTERLYKVWAQSRKSCES